MVLCDEIANARQKTIGVKQTTKALEKGRARTVYIAKDAEKHVVAGIVDLCEKYRIPVQYVDNMKQLGKACGIDVKCAVASVAGE